MLQLFVLQKFKVKKSVIEMLIAIAISNSYEQCLEVPRYLIILGWDKNTHLVHKIKDNS